MKIPQQETARETDVGIPPNFRSKVNATTFEIKLIKMTPVADLSIEDFEEYDVVKDMIHLRLIVSYNYEVEEPLNSPASGFNETGYGLETFKIS